MKLAWLGAIFWAVGGLSGTAAGDSAVGALEVEGTLRKGSAISGLRAGASLGTRLFGGQERHKMAVFQIHYGVVTSELLNEEKIFRGYFALGGEFLLAHQYEPDSASLVGATPMARYIFETDKRWKPFLEAGLGIAWTDIGKPRLGGDFQFSPQGGAGILWHLKRDLALAGRYRFIHYSNGGLRSPNSGINQNLFLIGLTRFH